MVFLIRLRPSWPRWWRWRAHDGPDDAGTVTVEYAIATMAAAALAGALLFIVRGKATFNGISSIVQRALQMKP